MKPPTKPVSRIIAISLVVVAVGGYFLWQRSSGPRYKGKTVEQWIRTVRPGDDLATNAAIRAMLVHLGTNAVPPLLRILEPKDTMLMQAYRRVSEMRYVPQSIRSAAMARDRRERRIALTAAEAMLLIGTKAEIAIPDLERLVQNTNNLIGGSAALLALAGIGRPAGPAITRLKSNAPTMRALYINATVEAAWNIALHLDDPAQREYAALELSWVGSPTADPIPVLETMCESQDADKREAAIRALSRLSKHHIGPAKRAFQRATNSAYPDIRQTAKAALDRLEDIRKLKTFD